MATDRRTVLAGLAGGLTAALAAKAGAAVPSSQKQEALYLGSRAEGDEGFRFTGFERSGAVRFDLPIPSRGHSFAVHRGRGLAVHFARRPGRWAVAVDLKTRAIVRSFHSPENRHYYGHGVFAADGRLLYVPENDFEARRGVLGVYDVGDGFRRVGEVPTHGIGPHDVHLLSDGRTLVVANGGIATDPGAPRVKLNIPTMDPSLAFVDRADGRLLRTVRLPASLHRLSIRHLSVNRDDRVAFAMQYQGPRGDAVPLIGTCAPDRPRAVLFERPRAPIEAMRLYCGSIVFDASGALLAASSPRGGLVTVWEAASGRHVGSYKIADTCGLAPAPGTGRFVASDGRGRVWTIDAVRRELRDVPVRVGRRPAWDNHLTRV